MARRADRVAGEARHHKPKQLGTARACTECGKSLSTYNPGPNCWEHTIGHPWRGPEAKPKY
jgi:hypothetical protein